MRFCNLVCYMHNASYYVDHKHYIRGISKNYESALDYRLYDGFDLKTYLLMRWWGPDALAVCRAHRGLPVGFLLLRYSI